MTTDIQVTIKVVTTCDNCGGAYYSGNEYNYTDPEEFYRQPPYPDYLGKYWYRVVAVGGTVINKIFCSSECDVEWRAKNGIN